MAGLHWSWVPYTHPGMPLALAIRKIRSKPLDVLILENHGLVVSARQRLPNCGLPGRRGSIVSHYARHL
jgi:rhamnose utilization protein RhaD (predicted bifunctional aldolase and dehydrogenase)